MRPKVVVVIPAWNEESSIRKAIRSIFKQDYPLEAVVVVADNCTDSTFAGSTALCSRYRRLGVMKTVGNKAKKAGALNQGLANLGSSTDYVLVMDADTRLHPMLLKEAINELDNNPSLGAVCSRAGVASPPPTISFWERIIWQIQHLEYGQFGSQRVETTNRIKVVHGMAAVYRMKSLKEVVAYREKRWGIKNQFYAENNLVEDYELTLCLKELGWEVTASMKMLAWTEVPLTLKALWRQRLRWLRGGVDSLKEHGWNRITKWDILNHGLFICLTCLQISILVLVLVAISQGIQWAWSPWLIAVFFTAYVDGLYRLKYVQDLKIGDVLVRLALIPELVYNWFQMAAMVRAYYLSLAKVNQHW